MLVTRQQNSSQTPIFLPPVTNPSFRTKLPSTTPSQPINQKQLIPIRELTQSLHNLLVVNRKWLWWGSSILILLGLSWLIQRNISQHLDQINQEKTQKNQQFLDHAKIPFRMHQASQFNEAIQFARQIQPHTPLYQEAQQNITRWSQAIYNIAQGKANQGDFMGAIAAAQLIPKDNQTLYSSAQQSIKHWQQQIDRH
ncbi:MAG: hypothetical protein AAGF26_13455 [Cyanobacteria bacterium P01_G01_bin.49]